jgi:prolipoprotein diacylglyceryl transferase
VIASIPSPTEGVWYLGPVPIRAYALAIMIGIVVAIWLGERRWIARGGRPGDVFDIAIWAVPFGIVGARAYHLITDWDNYFAAGREPLEALRIWEGGLSIWGAIAGGALGGWIAARRRGIPFPALADALAPGIVLAQAIGRWGNYFNNELYGRPTDLPWGLEVHQMQNFRAVRDETGAPVLLEGGPFHPIFLYESLWAVGTALVLIWADRRFRMGHGRVFALYVALYTAGRTWIENLRIDDGGDVAGPAREFLGMRVNAWVSVVLMIGAIAYIVISARLKPGRETVELLPLDGAEVEPVSGNAEADSKVDVDADDTAGEKAEVGARAKAGSEAEADIETEAEVGAEAEPGSAPEAEVDGEAEAEADVKAEAEADREAEVEVEGAAEVGNDGGGDVAERAGDDADTTPEGTNAEIVPERSEDSAAVSDSEESATERKDKATAKRDKAPLPEDASVLDDAAEASEPQR